ncbi:hypothetical protein E2320_006629 [Naja naja]|nr:hypothetical protein E2320_006629 [Naja naja]
MANRRRVVFSVLWSQKIRRSYHKLKKAILLSRGDECWLESRVVLQLLARRSTANSSYYSPLLILPLVLVSLLGCGWSWHLVTSSVGDQ